MLAAKRTRSHWFALTAMVTIAIAIAAFVIPHVLVLPRQLPIVILFSFLAYINYRLGRRDVLYPGFIFSFLWLSAFTLYTFCFVTVDDISIVTDALLIIGVCCFTIGSYFAGFLPRLSGLMRRIWHISESGAGKKICLFWVLAVFPLFYRDITRMAGGGWFPALSTARLIIVQLMLSGKTPYSSILTSSLPAISVMVALVFVLDRETRGSRNLTVFAVCISYLIALMTTGRPQILQLTLGLIAIMIFRSDKRSFVACTKTFFPAFLVLTVIIGGIAMVTKSEASDTTGPGPVEFASTHLVWYLVGNIPAFDKAVIQPEQEMKFMESRNSAIPRTLQSIGYLLGLNDQSDRAVDANFVFVPFPMNTDTAYASYYLGFGVAGIALFGLFAGLLHGWLFAMATHGSQAAMFLYCLYLYPLIMTIFIDQYMGKNFLHHLEIFLFMFVYYGFLRRMNWTSASLISKPFTDQ